MGDDQTIHVLLDTNLFLHFRRPDQIDWRQLADARRVVLLIAPVTMRELEKQKVHNGSRAIRRRASGVVNWLAEISDAGNSSELRPGVQLEFIPVEPRTGFATHRLVESVADDQLIASAIDYGTNKVASIVVATADLGLKVKLRHHGIDTVVVPEDQRLPPELDPLEKENQELRRQIARRPSLNLTFDGELQHSGIELLRLKEEIGDPSLEEMMAQHHKIDARCPTISYQESYIRSYNQDLDAYYERYQEYLDKKAKWTEKLELTHEIELVLANTGKSPASDIDVFLWFSPDLQLATEGDFEEMPQFPMPPRRPGHLPFEAHLSDILGQNGGCPDLFGTNESPDWLPVVNKKENCVGYSGRGLKHGFDQGLTGLRITFPSQGSLRSISINYEVSAAELPEVVTGQLHLKIK